MMLNNPTIIDTKQTGPVYTLPAGNTGPCALFGAAICTQSNMPGIYRTNTRHWLRCAEIAGFTSWKCEVKIHIDDLYKLLMCTPEYLQNKAPSNTDTSKKDIFTGSSYIRFSGDNKSLLYKGIMNDPVVSDYVITIVIKHMLSNSSLPLIKGSLLYNHLITPNNKFIYMLTQWCTDINAPYQVISHPICKLLCEHHKKCIPMEKYIKTEDLDSKNVDTCVKLYKEGYKVDIASLIGDKLKSITQNKNIYDDAKLLALVNNFKDITPSTTDIYSRSCKMPQNNTVYEDYCDKGIVYTTINRDNLNDFAKTFYMYTDRIDYGMPGFTEYAIFYNLLDMYKSYPSVKNYIDSYNIYIDNLKTSTLYTNQKTIIYQLKEFIDATTGFLYSYENKRKALYDAIISAKGDLDNYVLETGDNIDISNMSVDLNELQIILDTIKTTIEKYKNKIDPVDVDTKFKESIDITYPLYLSTVDEYRKIFPDKEVTILSKDSTPLSKIELQKIITQMQDEINQYKLTEELKRSSKLTNPMVNNMSWIIIIIIIIGALIGTVAILIIMVIVIRFIRNRFNKN